MPKSLSKPSRTQRVALVEDSATLRLFIENIIQQKKSQFEWLGSWDCAETALQALPDLEPDVVVVDLELPQMSGAELIRQLAPRMVSTAFVVLTVHDDPPKVFGALRAGANGYLLKGAKGPEIIASIRAASEGGAPLSQEIARLLIQSFQEPSKAGKKELAGLTPREAQILELLAQGKVAKEVAFELGLSYETVRDYMKSVYQKLHVRSRTEAVIKYFQYQES